MLRLAALAAALTACTHNTTNNHGPPPEASASAGPVAADAALAGDPTSCGAPLPTTAPATITLSGTAARIGSISTGGAATGAIVELVRQNGQVVATSTADAADTFTLTASTGGAPIDGYLRARFPGYEDMYQYPAVPYATDESGFALPMFDSASSRSLTAGAGARDPGDALLIVAISDCAKHPLAGAKLTIEPAGNSQLAYFANGAATAMTATDSSGAVMAKNVTPGMVRLDGEPLLHGHWIEARKDALTIVFMSP